MTKAERMEEWIEALKRRLNLGESNSIQFRSIGAAIGCRSTAGHGVRAGTSLWRACWTNWPGSTRSHGHETVYRR